MPGEGGRRQVTHELPGGFSLRVGAIAAGLPAPGDEEWGYAKPLFACSGTLEAQKGAVPTRQEDKKSHTRIQTIPMVEQRTAMQHGAGNFHGRPLRFWSSQCAAGASQKKDGLLRAELQGGRQR